MKQLLSLLFLFILSACSSIRVNADYEKCRFTQYKTYAFHKASTKCKYLNLTKTNPSRH
jgi:hypothetical protein